MTDRPFRDEPTEVLETALGLADTHAEQAARFQPAQPGDELPAVASLFRAELQHREGSVTVSNPPAEERRDRYAAAIAKRDGHEWPTEFEDDERDYRRRADAAIAVADAEQPTFEDAVLQLHAQELAGVLRREADDLHQTTPGVVQGLRIGASLIDPTSAAEQPAAVPSAPADRCAPGTYYCDDCDHAFTAPTDTESCICSCGARAWREKPADADLRDRVGAAIEDVFDRWRDGLGDQRPEDAIRDAVLAVLPPPAYRRLLARLEADRERHLRAAAQTKEAGEGELLTVSSTFASAFRHAAAMAVHAFEGPDAAQAYMQRTDGGEEVAIDVDLRDRIEVWPLKRVLAEVRCGSSDWTWEEEWADLDERHAETGYLAKLEQQIRENGITMPVLIGTDGRLWDGHHRLRIAVRLGVDYVPVEIVPPAESRRPFDAQAGLQRLADDLQRGETGDRATLVEGSRATVRCTCGGWFPIGHLHADIHQPVPEQADRVLDERVAAAKEQQATGRCTCPHPTDEHSIYGCADGCACEWMPKRTPMDPVHILGIDSEDPDEAAALRARLLSRPTPAVRADEARQADTAGEGR